MHIVSSGAASGGWSSARADLGMYPSRMNLFNDTAATQKAYFEFVAAWHAALE